MLAGSLVLRLALAVAAPAESWSLPPGLPFQPTALERERLERGQVVAHLGAPDGRGLREGMATARFDAPPDRVMRALLDLAHYEEWAPFVTQASAAALADGNFEQTQWMRLPAPLADRHFRLRVVVVRSADGAPRGLTWSYLAGSGNVRAFSGECGVLEAPAGGSLVWYRLYVDPGGLVPAAFVNRTVARSLPWILDGLRQQAHRWRYDPRARAGEE